MSQTSSMPVVGTDLLGDLLGHGLIERQDHERDGALVRAPQVHVADVDVGLAHGSAHEADGAGPVLVARDQHVGRGREVDLVAVEGDETRFPAEGHRARDRALSVERQQRGVAAGIGRLVARRG